MDLVHLDAVLQESFCLAFECARRNVRFAVLFDLR